MSSVTTNLVLTGEDDVDAVAYIGPGLATLAVVRIDGLTVQSSTPGALRRLADALNAAEDEADDLRSVLAAS